VAFVVGCLVGGGEGLYPAIRCQKIEWGGFERGGTIRSLHFLDMLTLLTLLQNPWYYRPAYWLDHPRFWRGPSLIERYLDALDDRFFSLLDEDPAELLGLESETPASKPEPSSAQSNTTTPGENVTAATTDPKAENVTSGPKQAAKPISQYVSHTKSRFNGRDYVEEHREKVIGSDGDTRIATRRRLGDRWCESQVHIDKDGKKTERETWHNVAEDQMDKFNLEWNERHQGDGKAGKLGSGESSAPGSDAAGTAPGTGDPANTTAVPSDPAHGNAEL
jgi:hypothetical protein